MDAVCVSCVCCESHRACNLYFNDVFKHIVLLPFVLRAENGFAIICKRNTYHLRVMGLLVAVWIWFWSSLVKLFRFSQQIQTSVYVEYRRCTYPSASGLPARRFLTLPLGCSRRLRRHASGDGRLDLRSPPVDLLSVILPTAPKNGMACPK